MTLRWISASGVLSILAGAALAGPGATAPAGAQTGVGSDGARVTVTGYRAGGSVHTAVQSSSSSGSALVCRELIDSTAGGVDFDATVSWPPVERGRVAVRRFWLSCTLPDGTPVGLAGDGMGYLYEEQIVDLDAVVRTLAERYLAERLAPVVAVQTSPPQGLVGVEQWFWLTGVEPGAVREVHDVFGRRVELIIEPAAVQWTFGDGAAVTVVGPAGLGGASGGVPAEPVTHRYRDRSTVEDPSGTYPVVAAVELSVRYTLDGAGPFEVQPPLRADAASALVVREAQAVLHRG
ncbi:MAG: hypothetical protein AB7W59_10825 [Acidimicrobiia bacterium]